MAVIINNPYGAIRARLEVSKLTGGHHIGNVLTTPLGTTVHAQHVGGFLEVSDIMDGSTYGYHSATAAHTARYDLQADMIRRTSWRAVCSIPS